MARPEQDDAVGGRIDSVDTPESRADRARGCLLGLAIGDAMGAPAENMSAEAIRRRWGTVDGFLTDDPAGTDDTEFAAFSATLLIRHGRALTSFKVAAAWREHLTARTAFPGGGFSTLAAVQNLRAGIEPPGSGRHLHSWSDSLAMRAAVFGVYASGEPDLAAGLAAEDGVVELAGEGVFGGQAVAAAVAVAMSGGDAETCVDAALDVVPHDSWTARSIEAAVLPARVEPDESDGSGDRIGPLSRDQFERVVAGRRYPWTDLAPEAVSLAFAAFLAADGAFRPSVTGAISMGRDADTTAAIAGALAGASSGMGGIPDDWRTAIGPITGRCLGEVVAGLEPVELADRLVEASSADGREVER